MTTFTNDNNWAERAEVFLGTLHIVDSTADLESPLGENARSVHLSEFKDRDGQVIGGQSDWLVAGHEQPATVLRFLFHSRTSDRLHFMISGSGADHEKKLGISRNGYLGLYAYASVRDYFKLEPLHWGDDAVICRWRDHQGHVVRTHHDPAVSNPRFSYLRVGEGEEVTFRIERINI
ncbi:hypothetical protein DM813_09050 [Pseudomonas alkylphenolica]|uniref:Uncharacterized protein n=1 Tax=Pseudomonas alkylphenolica TaxID=237609 RepID=A0A443ZV68_9PSED|nr:hypothetical protein [Pseudomonas alkylphenolica]RWU23955.1 hypothetical protein DM813_09050 [Pseudomonas alkylphenolica]